MVRLCHCIQIFYRKGIVMTDVSAFRSNSDGISGSKEVIEQAYGCPWNEIFAFISDTPLGSASIAQVHRAELLSGEQVVIKVQRTGIYEIMARDIGLLRKAVKLMPPISLKGMADFDQVLDELWNVTREEMNFLTEASNMEEFARRNADVVYVRTPKLYQEYTTMYVLVMDTSWACDR